MSVETSPATQAPLSGSEGLRPFSFSGVNKFELQTANDLFEQYSSDKDPRTLGKLNALRIDIMKRAAEAEIAKLTPIRSRIQIETEMRERQVSKAQANDELAYILVTYLSNIEKLDAERRAGVAKTEGLAKEQTGALKVEVDSKKKIQEVPKGKAPEVAKTKEGAEEKLSELEKKNAEFIHKNQARIDVLIAKLPEGEAKIKIPSLLAKPNDVNIKEIQTLAGLKGDGSRGVDGKFGNHTLQTLEKMAGIASKKKATEDVRPWNEQKTTTKKPVEQTSKKAKKSEEESVEPSEAEKERLRVDAENRQKSERLIVDLQREALKNLKPLGDDKYVPKTEFFKDGFSGNVFFKFDSQKGEWLWNSFNNSPDTWKSSKWQSIEGLRTSTTEGVTKMGTFGFTASAQEAVNAMLIAEEKAKEFGIKLKSPSARSGIVDQIPV